MIATKQQPWLNRNFLTREQVKGIHATHRKAITFAFLTVIISMALFLVSGYNSAQILGLSALTIVFAAYTAGTFTDLTSMRIPDTISAMPLGAAVIWIILEGAGYVTAPEAGAVSKFLGMVGYTPSMQYMLPALPQDMFIKDLGFDVLSFTLIFAFLFFSMNFGFGGGDVKLMAASSLFFGWPLAFDFVAMTFVFGGLISIVIIAARLIIRLISKLGLYNAVIDKILRDKPFAFAPAIAASALLCIAVKFEGVPL